MSKGVPPGLLLPYPLNHRLAALPLPLIGVRVVVLGACMLRVSMAVRISRGGLVMSVALCDHTYQLHCQQEFHAL
jgi:hypothetical protein